MKPLWQGCSMTKVENLRKEIVTKCLPDPLSKAKGDTKTKFVLKPVTEGQILKAIMKLKNKDQQDLIRSTQRC
jgi:hypothetical protein